MNNCSLRAKDSPSMLPSNANPLPARLKPTPAFHVFPSHSCTTAHLPLHAHFLAPESPPPPSVCLISSSRPGGNPTTTSALQVRRASDRTPDPSPSGPRLSLNGVVGSQAACITDQQEVSVKGEKDRTYIASQLPVVEIPLENDEFAFFQIL